MFRHTTPCLALAAGAALVAASATPAVASERGKGDMHRKDMSRGAQVYQVDLDALNHSGVEGKATLVLRGDQLRVVVRARGLTPGMVHPQHIHGLDGMMNATCPPPSAAGTDGLLTLEDGLPFYGPVLQPLEPFPTANKAGVVTYTQTFHVDRDLADLSDEAIVLHGAFVRGDYVATLPVACGEID